MAKKKKGIGASFRQQVEQVPVVQQKAPRTISTNVSTGGGGLGASLRSATKTATQKAEEERSARMRQGLSKTFSSVVRASFNNQRNLQPTTVQKGLYSNLRNQLAPVKHNADYTRSQQTKFLSTDLQRKGLNTPMSQLMAGKTNVGVEQGKALRAGMPTNSNVIESWRRTATDAERNARQKYGYDKDFAQKQITERLDNSGKREVFDPSNGKITTALPAKFNAVAPNEATYKAGDALRSMRWDDVRSGFADAFARKNVEDTAERQFGRTVDDDTLARLEEQRSTLGYGTGMAAGQMAQYALTRGLLSGAGLVGRGAKAADTAGKAFRAEMAIDQAASVPLNLIDAMKEDNLEGIVKRFGLNQGLDLVFGAFTEGISIKRNPLYQNAETKHIAAKEARQAGDNAAANALDQSARRDLGAISNAELDESRNDIVARVGEQRRIINDEQVNAIQNAEGTVGEFPSTDYAYRNGSDRANYDNMRDDMLGAIESQEAIGAGNVPNDIGMRADVRPYEPTRPQLTGIDKVLADYNMSADELIERLQDPSFNDPEMLEDIANDIVPVGRRRGISIDAERQYADNVKNYRQSARSADSILGSNDVVPTKDQITSGNASYGGIPLKYKPGMHAEAENYTKEIWVSNKFFDLSPENQRHVLNHEVAHNYADDLMGKNTGNWNEFADKFIKEKNVPVNSPMYKNGVRTYWEGLYGDIGATSLSETVTRAITEYLDNPSALRNRSTEAFDVIDNYMLGRTIPSRGETYRRMLSDSVIDELRRSQTPNVEDDVARAVPAEQTAREATQQTTRAVPADNTASRAVETTETPNRIPDEWNDIPNVAAANDEPQDLMRANPHRKENTIPKASDQKTRKEVLFRGETADRNGAKETAEQVAEAPKKRNQVKGVLVEEKPKTEYSDMSTAELQAQRHRFEEQARYDANPGTSEDEILKIDEEFARRGEKPNWFSVEPEQGGKRVRSPIEARRENDELVEKYGEFNNGTTKKVETEDGVKRNSKSIDTMLKDVSPETEHVVLNNMLDGDYARDGKTVREFVEEVNNHLAENPEAYMEKLANFGEKLDPRERLVGVEVAQAYAKNIGNVEYENKMVEAYMKIVPEAASLLKIHGILKKMSKPARKDYIEQAIAKFEKRFAKRLKKAKIDHLSLSEETREAIINAKTSEQTSKAWAKASVEIWNQIPASGKEKADFIRINAMLLNPKTHIRNVLGNAIFKPMREMKNITGTGLEFFFEKVGKLGGFEKVKLDKSARTKALVPDRQGMDYAAVILKENGDAIRGISKYIENLAEGRPFDNGAKLWMAGRQNGNPIINGFRKFADGVGDINSWALEHEDFHYFDKAFKTQYGRAMKARGLTLKDLVDNPRLSDEITEVATHEALRATYRDESAAARIISKWKNPGENAKPMRKAAGLALDSILPFTKTPINILRRAIDYSPVGAGKGIYHLVRGFHDGNQKMVVQGIDQLASAIPGSGLGMLGWFLAENDGVTAKLGSDKEDQFMKDLGKQNFSIVFNSGTDKEFSYTVDWAAPGCIPFFTGVALNEMSENRLDFWEAADAIEQMLEPMTEMSVMQGIKNTLETFQRESGGGVMQGLMSVGINTGLSYAGQFKPTLVSQTARMIDPVRRDTTSTAESATKRQIERWVNKQKAGIPGLSQTLNPYQNVWGEEEKNTYNDSIPLRILENYFSPGYAKANKADDVDKELLNIYKKDPTASSVLPAKYSQYEIGFDGGTVRFSYDDRSNFIKVQGKVSKQDLRKLFDTQEYKDASLTEKQKMIANVYSDAKGEAKRDTLLKMGKDEWKVYTDDFSGRKTEYQDAKDADLKAKQYYDYMTTKDWDLDESGKPVKSELALYLNKQDDLSDEQRAVIFGKLANGNTKNPYDDGTAHTTDWQAEYDKYLAKKNKDKDGSSSSKSRGGKKGRSGRRSGGGGSGSSKTKARAKTASEKRFAALQKMKAPTTGKGIEALSQGAKGLTKAQKKALLKLMQKKLDV